MAFTLIKREVLDMTRQDYDIWFTMDREPRLTFKDEWEEKERELIKFEDRTAALREAVEFGQDSHLNSNFLVRILHSHTYVKN